MAGRIPQIDLGPWGERLGGVKQLFQRSGIIRQIVVFAGVLLTSWNTTPKLQSIFPSYAVFLACAALAALAYMVLDYCVILPAEMSFTQNQAHGSAARSPLKADTEEILARLEALEHGESDDET